MLRAPHLSLWKAVRRPDTMRIGGFSVLAPFERHVFVCQNVRPEGAPRPSCTKDGKSELCRSCSSLSRPRAHWRGERCASTRPDAWTSASMGRTVVVYPEAVWYGHVQAEDAEEIVDRAPGGREAGGTFAAGRCLREHQELPASGVQQASGRCGSQVSSITRGCTACGRMGYLRD